MRLWVPNNNNNNNRELFIRYRQVKTRDKFYF